MTAFTQAFSTALIHFIWQGGIVAALLWITLFVLRRESANSRYLASCIALAIMAVLPIATLYLTYDAGVTLPKVSASTADVKPVTAAISSVAGSVSQISASWFVWAQAWSLTIWSFGVILFSLRIVWAGKHVYTLKRRGAAAERPIIELVNNLAKRIGVYRPVRVLISSMADGPSVVGWLRPVVLLPPASVLGLSPEQLEAVIAHEIAHIRRHDYVVAAFQAVIETLLFYHPAVWWASNRLRHERELCCDDAAVRACGNAVTYARALTKLEKIRVMKPSIVLGSTDGSLFYRVQRLIGVRTQEYGPSKWPAVLLLLFGLAGLSANRTWARAESPALQEKIAGPEARDQAGVTVNVGGSSIVHRTAVEYPRAAIEKGIQGTVSIEATIDGVGNVVDARVLTGPQELRKTVIQSVLQWHFASDGAQGTRVVHIVFDATEAKNRKEEAGEFVAFAYAPTTVAVVTGSAAEGEVRKGFFTVNQEDARRLEEIKRAEGSAQAVRKIGELRKAEAELQAQGTPGKLIDPQLAEELKRKVAIEKQRQPEAVWFPRVTPGELHENREIAKKLEMERTVAEKLRFTSANVDGSVVKGIRVFGLSDQVTQDLISKLPIRVGETLTQQLMEATSAAIRRFDEHLEHQWLPTEDNTVEIRIVAPGFRGDIRRRP